jgi:hypothetical protein
LGSFRYEAGSTIFGPHQLEGYIQEFTKLAVDMATGAATAPGTPPKDFSKGVLDTGPGHDDEGAPHGYQFGGLLQDVPAAAARGAMVEVQFVGGCPRNGLPAGQTSFLEVQLQAGAGRVTVAEDGDVETRYRAAKTSSGPCPVCTCKSPTIWPISGCDISCGAKCADGRCCCIGGEGKCPSAKHALAAPEEPVGDAGINYRRTTVSWEIPADAAAGSYRVVVHGQSCNNPLVGKTTFTPYTGTSSVFTVA